MDTNYRTLADVATGGVEGLEVTNFNTFLISFNLQLIHRFPDVTDLSTIDYNEVRRIAEFCASLSIVAQEVWTSVSTPDKNKGRMIARQQRTQAA